jgi:membrane protein DedA with SNARE-associated domain
MKKLRKLPWWVSSLVMLGILGIGIYAFNHIYAWLGFIIILGLIVYVLVQLINKFKDYEESSED